ncbi:2-amino-3,7-dideoxy-D-threo-hept-6-ulosonate synthase [Micromonospora sp. NPDC023814]|uniref:2-amino-3,7-dideoxy-D-threo-hept-6-ulosonate synthase n=1 Tax=Micromonospora sp. NPDC023814 TaxID=3154596 RepID=UPI0033D8BBCE
MCRPCTCPWEASVLDSGTAFARRVRLHRLYRHREDRLFVVPLDHPISDGPVTGGGRRLDHLVGVLAAGGVDAVVLHKGSLRHINPRRFTDVSLVVHLSASTVFAADPDAKVLVASVEEALRLGADAVSVHVNLGSMQEARQLADLATVADACDRWNLPLLAMMYPRGPQVTDPNDPELVAHAATVAAELGADIVKTPYPGSAANLALVTNSCPVPVLPAGGAALADEAAVRTFVQDVLAGGSGGIAMGRNVFQASDPGATVRMLSALVHADTYDDIRIGAGK